MYSSMSSLKNPGPGSYNIDRHLGRVSYSFGLKGPSTLLGTKGSPGPGQYNARSTFINIPGSKIGRSQRSGDLRPKSPGPGAYNGMTTLAHCATKQDAPRYGFGTGNREKIAAFGNVFSPGPGAYNHKEITGKDGPAKTMVARRPESARSFVNNPGPGSYTP